MKTKTTPNDELTFSINEVSKIIGVVPATIRNWEKSGLFTAKRKENNYRVYTIEDIEVLKKIKKYSIDESMPINAIKSLFVNEQIFAYEGVSSQRSAEKSVSNKILSSKWKECRDQKGATLEEAANSIGISVSYLSKIENGHANVSYEILEKLAQYYGESLLYFFDINITEEKVVRENQGETIAVGYDGVKIQSLVAVKDHMLYPVMFEIEPGSGSRGTHSHSGEEFVHVLEGELDVILNFEENLHLEAGDSIYFSSADQHSWKNNGKTMTKLLWVHSPISSRNTI